MDEIHNGFQIMPLDKVSGYMACRPPITSIHPYGYGPRLWAFASTSGAFGWLPQRIDNLGSDVLSNRECLLLLKSLIDEWCDPAMLNRSRLAIEHQESVVS